MLRKSIIVVAALFNALNLPITYARHGGVENDGPNDNLGGDPGEGFRGNSNMTGMAVLANTEAGVTFALNVPSNSTNELFFTLRGPSDRSWIAVGMGFPYMRNSLFFMAYQSANGKEVTVSPRTVNSHVEPMYTKDITIEMLSGSGVSNGVMTANVRCINCRSWKGGSIDIARFQPMIYASGPKGSFRSDSRDASVKRHAMYGVFAMDLVQATGDPGINSSISLESSSGVNTDGSHEHDHNYPTGVHGIIMVVTYLLIMPLGVIILRVINSVKWHGWNQALAVVLAIAGSFAGIYASTFFNRSKNFNSGHQVFGIFITSAVLVQIVLGFLHHRMFKKTNQTTKLAPVHIWLGRIVIPCGIVNVFIGFPFALNGHYDWIIFGISIGIGVLVFLSLWWRFKRNRQIMAQRPISLDDISMRYNGNRNINETGSRNLKSPEYSTTYQEHTYSQG